LINLGAKIEKNAGKKPPQSPKGDFDCVMLGFYNKKQYRFSIIISFQLAKK